MKISPKRSPKIIFEENPTQKGVPREASGAKQQEQVAPREANPGSRTEIWHGLLVPGGTTVPRSQKDTVRPCRLTRPWHFPALLLVRGGRKGEILCNFERFFLLGISLIAVFFLSVQLL